MYDDWDFLSIFSNKTRRDILKSLCDESSYALNISRQMRISSQAVNKQIDILESMGIISPVNMQSRIGPARKVYEPGGFSTIIIDYSRSFMGIKRMELTEIAGDKKTVDEMLSELKSVNNEINEMDKKRAALVSVKDSIIKSLKEKSSMMGEFHRNIINTYIETMDAKVTASYYGLPEAMVRKLINEFKNIG
ncbi:ArsR/SmtB family transcription factor [Picrophilus oshimae]|uniref:ArsS family-protein n=1 Tax=Picrophilus torridus (strain ATCC 700027 / DSM 9790 / JCM 10055 / NBRC 100828 / KAW 2/3) TaxID=1122961 RepID=Q6L1Z7_PICTO|nr:helix-turn-helix domain-containing protein [Picrophilus oshimae]AAT43005.1 ArsS family-protein [Picrophilus oshimae DSM 9789]